LFDDYLCNNQPKQVLMMEMRKERRFDWGGAQEDCDSIVLGAIELGYYKI
jgi:hypothetical protein